MRTPWIATALVFWSLSVCPGQFDTTRADALSQAARNGDKGAVDSLRALAAEGDAAAQNALGLVPTPEGSAYWYGLAARQGFRTAQVNLGHCYVRGCEAEPETEKGLRWLTIAADQGHWFAQATLGDLYRGQHGVARNDVESYKWYAVAASTAALEGRDDAREALLGRIALLEPRMTPAQIAEGQELAASWKPRPWSELRANLPE